MRAHRMKNSLKTCNDRLGSLATVGAIFKNGIFLKLTICMLALSQARFIIRALAATNFNDEMSHYLVERSFRLETVAGHQSHARRSIYDESLNKNGASDVDYSESDNIDPGDQHSPNGLATDQHQSQMADAERHQNLDHRTSQNSTNNDNFDQQQQQVLQQQTQKRFLTRELIQEACDLDRGSQRDERINNSYLSHCSRYKLETLLSSELLMSIMHHDTKDCVKLLDEFVQLDEVIAQFDKLFKNLLTRYNCQNGYSVKWSCEDCKKAYTDWICATHLPFYMNGERIKPCISFCERVEQRCPYLHPITREQYGGQPVFICRDPNIPFVPSITPEISYNDPGRCYDLCHVSDNLTELITDSLSKYDYDKCPDKSSIAEEVRSDPYYCGSVHCALIKLSQEDVRTTTEMSDYTTSDNIEKYDETVMTIGINRVMQFESSTTKQDRTKVIPTQPDRKRVHVHRKKLDELREVLANYKNQAKTHRYHADHSSIYNSAANHQH